MSDYREMCEHGISFAPGLPTDGKSQWCGECYPETPELLFVKGQRVCAKAPYQAQWRVGIITDVFLAPVTQQYVYVIGGEGYYASEVSEFVTEPEPQSLRVAP